jgi:hypothetical protein
VNSSKRRYGKRRPRGEQKLKEVKIWVSESAYEKLDALAGEESLSWAFEKLVERELLRRAKKMERVMNTPANLVDSAC